MFALLYLKLWRIEDKRLYRILYTQLIVISLPPVVFYAVLEEGSRKPDTYADLPEILRLR